MASHQRNAVRRWAGLRLNSIGLEIAWQGEKLIRSGLKDQPLCPCQIGPDVGDNCPVCAESWERQKTDEAIYGSGYEAGRRASEPEGSGPFGF